MRVLVTGSSGLVGRELEKGLRASGHAVRKYDIADGVSDIRDRVKVAAAMRGCDGVVHLAAISRVAWGETFPELCHSVNVGGTALLLDLARQHSQPPWFLFVSSREIYGDPDDFPVREDAPMRPTNRYGASKAEGERLVEAACASGLRTSILRLSNVYGSANDHPDRAVPSLLWSAMIGQELRISGAETFFDFVHVDDCVEGLLIAAAMLNAGHDRLPPVHLVTGQKTSLGDLARIAISVARSRSSIRVDPPRSFDVKGFYGTPARAMERYGWSAKIDLEQGMKMLHAVFNARGAPLKPIDAPLPRNQNQR
jgi:nucleoside-diphosphate-sugar epimerase